MGQPSLAHSAQWVRIIAMPLTLDEVRHVAQLARLELEDTELEAFRLELESLLQHFEDIQDAPIDGRPPKPHAVALVNVMRDDVPGAHLSRDDALAPAARTRAGLFIVPTILEDGA